MSTLLSLYFFLRLSVVGTVYIAVVDVLQKKDDHGFDDGDENNARLRGFVN